MELLLASSADKLGKLMVGAMEDVEADLALLNTFKPLIDILLPELEPSHDGAVLI